MVEVFQRLPTFRPGQIVRTAYGDIRTVRDQGGPNNCMVWLVGELTWHHPAKLSLLVR